VTHATPPAGEDPHPTRVFERLDVYEAWDRDYYPPAAQALYDRTLAHALRWLRAVPGERVLDAGCGPGVHSVRLARHGLAVDAIDVSDAALAEARRRAEAAGVADRIRLARGDLTSLSLPDASYGQVLCWGVVIHIPELEQSLAELARILAPGGRLALQVTNRRALDHRFEALARRLLRRPAPPSERRALGDGRWYESESGALWVWQVDVDALVAHLRARGLELRDRRAVELTHLQRRSPGPLRRVLLWLNDRWSALGLPAGPAATNLLIFEKIAAPHPALAGAHSAERAPAAVGADGPSPTPARSGLATSAS
jgi:SAM-dependent methyltransferase